MNEIVLAEGTERLALYWACLRHETLVRLVRKLSLSENRERRVILEEQKSDAVELAKRKPVVTRNDLSESLVQCALTKIRTRCPFRYQQHCAFVGVDYIDQEHLRDYHLEGLENSCPTTASFIYALSQRRTRLERLQLQFRNSKPKKLSFTTFMFPTNNIKRKVVSFITCQKELSIFGDYKHGHAVKFGLHGKHPDLVNQYAYVVGVKNKKLWVTIKGTEIALPVYVPGCTCSPEEVADEYDLWSIEGKIHLRNHAVPVTEVIWGVPGAPVVQRKPEVPKVSAMDRVKKKINIVSKFGFGFAKAEKAAYDPLVDFHKDIDKQVATEYGGLIPKPPQQEPDIYASDEDPEIDKDTTNLSF
eukprot:TRINITY_DN25783_c0_g1_i1.p1 TRINITY_DN25783_c0_g1~~TRINITY_DN25783_c0_g1_i1.p1  ORF type:complete len:359 (+),score=53.29 TRINITY_DN25783_c0_g1_i1:121-1197(+)